MTEPVRWGILSTAEINKRVIPAAQASPKVELRAVASRDRDRAEAYARQWQIERWYASYEALLADPEIEAVYISLPNSMHCDWSVRALEAGKHVLCEKPLSRRPGEVEAAFDTALAAGRFLTEAFMYRHHPQTARLSQLLSEGVIGTLRLVRAAFSFALYDESDIRLRPELDGGALMDVGCYCLSYARLLAGEPERVSGQAWFGTSGTDWVFGATLGFAGDVIGLFDCGTALPRRAALEACGSEGALVLHDPWHCAAPVIELWRDDGIERIEIEQADPYQLELENLSDAIRGGDRPLLAREDAMNQARALDALHGAVRTGTVVSL